MKRSSWEIQKAVIFALLMREMKTRFGDYRLGYLWAIMEPVAHVAILAIVFGFVVGKTLPGINYPLFLVTGIMPWLLFSNIISRGMSAISANKALFNYRQLRPFDTLLTRIILEALIYVFAYIVILLFAYWIGIDFILFSALEVLIALTLLTTCAAGIAMSFCVINSLYPELGKFLPYIMRPLYFMSGIFFSINTIPQEYHHILTWNPVIHVAEISRVAFFNNYQTSSEISLTYLSTFSLVSLLFGLSLFRQSSKRLITS